MEQVYERNPELKEELPKLAEIGLYENSNMNGNNNDVDGILESGSLAKQVLLVSNLF